ncbi:MAG: hypothetical protein JSV93_02200 [Candidatus Omnitrophota bacterium]|nr:MAG: hypothetical protein JSV93_02200 [Candidatus Omnitrophota bacterium]
MKKKKIKFNWETEEERIKKHMRISAKQKLIWLQKFDEFIYKSLSDKEKKLNFKRRLTK